MIIIPILILIFTYILVVFVALNIGEKIGEAIKNKNNNMFPQKTKFLKRPIGWKDLGKEKERTEVRDDDIYYVKKTHKLCGSYIHIAKQDNDLFEFCPRCLLR